MNNLPRYAFTDTVRQRNARERVIATLRRLVKDFGATTDTKLPLDSYSRMVALALELEPHSVRSIIVDWINGGLPEDWRGSSGCPRAYLTPLLFWVNCGCGRDCQSHMSPVSTIADPHQAGPASLGPIDGGESPPASR
jgi:hypothetical protein